MSSGSGAGGHVGGEDVVGVAVEVLAGPVVTHCGTWVGMAGSDLYVPEVHTRVKTGREQCFNHAEYPGLGGGAGAAQRAGRGVPGARAGRREALTRGFGLRSCSDLATVAGEDMIAGN
jgi:hypothetical protein